MIKFEAGKEYGNDLTIEVISRTEKTITIKAGGFGTKRVKLKPDNGVERIFFKCWIIEATELFDIDEARRIYNEYAYTN
jgi:hypothetical protein